MTSFGQNSCAYGSSNISFRQWHINISPNSTSCGNFGSETFIILQLFIDWFTLSWNTKSTWVYTTQLDLFGTFELPRTVTSPDLANTRPWDPNQSERLNSPHLFITSHCNVYPCCISCNIFLHVNHVLPGVAVFVVYHTLSLVYLLRTAVLFGRRTTSNMPTSAATFLWSCIKRAGVEDATTSTWDTGHYRELLLPELPAKLRITHDIAVSALTVLHQPA